MFENAVFIINTPKLGFSVPEVMEAMQEDGANIIGYMYDSENDRDLIGAVYIYDYDRHQRPTIN